MTATFAPAVERALEGADPRHHARVHVGQGRHGDARRERRGVQLVVRVKDERGVHRLLGERARLPTGEHVEEVPGERQARARRDRRLALPDPAPRRDQRGHLRLDAHGFAQVRLPGVVARVRIVHPERRDRRPEDVHRVGLPREAPDQRQDLGGQAPLGRQGLPEALELRTLGESAVPEQGDRLLERGMRHQVVDVVASIEKPPPITVDEADLGGRHDHVLESGIGRLSRHEPPPLARAELAETRAAPHRGPLRTAVIVAHGPGAPQPDRARAATRRDEAGQEMAPGRHRNRGHPVSAAVSGGRRASASWRTAWAGGDPGAAPRPACSSASPPAPRGSPAARAPRGSGSRAPPPGPRAARAGADGDRGRWRVAVRSRSGARSPGASR